jgi:hypothetical protein
MAVVRSRERDLADVIQQLSSAREPGGVTAGKEVTDCRRAGDGRTAQASAP